MTSTINSQGVRLVEQDYQWLGSPPRVDLLVHQQDLLIISGRRFHVRLWEGAYQVLLKTHHDHLALGRFSTTRENLAGRLICRVLGCSLSFHEGYFNLCQTSSRHNSSPGKG